MIRNLKLFILHPQSISVGLGFFTISMLFGTWATKLPELQSRIGLTGTQLGMSLLALSIGSLIISPFSSWITEKMSVGRATFWSSVILAVSFISPFLANDFITFSTALFIVGLANGFITVTTNAAAAIVEKSYFRSIMSNCHGMFSFGGIIGAGSAGIFAALGFSPLANISIIVITLLFVNFYVRTNLYQIPNEATKVPVFTLPTQPIFGLIIITFCIVLAEVAIMDWSGIYIQNTLGGSAFITGLGFAGFSTTMAIGRFYGDHIAVAIGRKKIVQFGSLIGMSGLVMAAMIPSTTVAILSFTIVGIGFSCIIPIIFSSATKIEGITAGAGIAAIATAAVLGGLVGRPVIGLIADSFDLGTSLIFAGALALIASVVASKINWS
jgi:fucose permease